MISRNSAISRAQRDQKALARLEAAEIRATLSEALPRIPCRYFYDDRGSRLFEDITRLPEYYQTRTETRILAEAADGLVARVQPNEIVELGSGAGTKVRLLLDAMQRRGLLERCCLFDVNDACIEKAVASLKESYPLLDVRGVQGDFLVDLDAIGPGGSRLALLLAGTIGNLEPQAVTPFLAGTARVLEPGDGFLVGLDLVKDRRRLEAAYNDAQGVTAAFNLNILLAMNARFGADFDLAAFEHVAFYDPVREWIEMRVRATRRSRVRIPAADLELDLATGDEIRTEVSCKYTRASFAARLPGRLFDISAWRTDAAEDFALCLLERTRSETGLRPPG